MAVGQQVWFQGSEFVGRTYFQGAVLRIDPNYGALVAFKHGGGAWMAENELFTVAPREETT